MLLYHRMRVPRLTVSDPVVARLENEIGLSYCSQDIMHVTYVMNRLTLSRDCGKYGIKQLSPTVSKQAKRVGRERRMNGRSQRTPDTRQPKFKNMEQHTNYMASIHQVKLDNI